MFLLFMGVDVILVFAAVFKTDRGARAVPGGFDSHALPPIKQII
jgi:hypothetical protein